MRRHDKKIAMKKANMLFEQRTNESFEGYSNDALTDMIVNLSRYEGNEADIQNVKKELDKRKGVSEEFEGFNMTKPKTPTSRKLMNTAVRDGYMGENEMSAAYIMAAAKEVAAAYDKRHPEEQKALRDNYYNMFLKKIGKK